jgi:hypothetical protein
MVTVSLLYLHVLPSVFVNYRYSIANAQILVSIFWQLKYAFYQVSSIGRPLPREHQIG